MRTFLRKTPAILAILALACMDFTRSQPGNAPASLQLGSGYAGGSLLYIVPSIDTLRRGGSRALSAVLRRTDGEVIATSGFAWSSEDSSIASVDDTGAVRAKALGTVSITVSYRGRDAHATLTVVDSSTPNPPPPPPPAPPPGASSLYSSYRTTSPHWPHLTTMVTDFYYGISASERKFIAAHYDLAMAGKRSDFVGYNPTGRHIRYVLNWTVVFGESGSDIGTRYYADMKAWYAQHPQYLLEDAFIHIAGGGADSAARMAVKIWDSNRWIIDGGDAGARAYQADRARRAAQDEDGLFFDEYGSGMTDVITRPMREYSSKTDFIDGHIGMAAAIKAALGSKILQLNTAEYTNDADRRILIAAGDGHLERMNNPLNEAMPDRWSFIDALLQSGVRPELVSLYSFAEAAGLHQGGFNAGNYPNTLYREKMWELASYYMVVPTDATRLSLLLENMWSENPSATWLKAQEANIGHPQAARRVLAQGRDPIGQPYKVYARDFDRALVLVRPTIGWQNLQFGDNTAITVPLPAGEVWLPLRGDGTLGAAVTNVTLRQAEAMILVRRSRL